MILVMLCVKITWALIRLTNEFIRMATPQLYGNKVKLEGEVVLCCEKKGKMNNKFRNR